MFLRYNLVDDDDLKAMRWSEDHKEGGNRTQESEK